MSDPCFLGEVVAAVPGSVVEITGAEGHHAGSVRRIRVGESVLVTDGQGHAVRGPAIEVTKGSVSVETVEILHTPATTHRWVAVQALPKSDRAELAVATLTEMGVHEILAWQADRSIVRWKGDKQAKGVARWQAAAREATKQSRRFLVPQVELAQTREVVKRICNAQPPTFCTSRPVNRWCIRSCRHPVRLSSSSGQRVASPARKWRPSSRPVHAL